MTSSHHNVAIGRLVGAALVGALCACKVAEPMVCTQVFAFVPLVVRDAGGAPVTGLAIADTVLRTREGFAVPPIGGLPAGIYDIFDDGFANRIRVSGDSVRVVGTGALRFTADFFFDVPSGCHVRKVAGPDTVVAR